MSKKRAVNDEDRREIIESSGTKRSGGKKVIFFVVMAGAIALTGAGYYMKGAKKTTTVVTEARVDRTGMSSEVMTIPLSEITREAKFYQAKVGNIPVRFFVMKSSDGMIRSALDACDTCAHTLKGYRQQGDYMVCNNCDQKFLSNNINVLRGGCNPVPLNNSVEGDVVKIKVADIQLGAPYFNYGR
jgi:uncharacterized membrane protein